MSGHALNRKLGICSRTYYCWVLLQRGSVPLPSFHFCRRPVPEIKSAEVRDVRKPPRTPLTLPALLWAPSVRLKASTPAHDVMDSARNYAAATCMLLLSCLRVTLRQGPAAEHRIIQQKVRCSCCRWVQPFLCKLRGRIGCLHSQLTLQLKLYESH